MAFATAVTPKNESSENKINWDDLNKYVVDTAELTEKQTVIGIVSSIIDLGIQAQPDSEFVFTGTEKQEEEEIAKDSSVYFETKWDYDSNSEKRFKCKPQKDKQSITMTVDLPSIIVDKGKFFGESKPLPLRIVMGSQFFIKDVGHVVARPIALKESTKIDGKNWSLDKKSTLHKMAVSARIIGANDNFPSSRIDEILGHAFLFEVRVYFKKSKDSKSEYFTEEIKFLGPVMKGMPIPEYNLEPALIQFPGPNKDEDVANIRNHVVNTIRLAKNFSGSELEAQLERVKGSKQKEEAETPAEEKAPAAKATKPKVTKPAKAEESNPFDDMDGDIPF